MKAGDRFNLTVIQEKIKNAKAYLKTHRKRVHSLLLQLFLWTSVLCLIQLFYLRQDLELCSQKNQETYNDVQNASSYYVNALLYSGYMNAAQHAESLRDDLVRTITTQYNGNMRMLKSDLNTYFSANNVNNQLYRIIANTAYTYEDRWFQNRKDVQILVVSHKGVLFSTDRHNALRQATALEELFKWDGNNVLAMNIYGDPSDIQVLSPSQLSKDINALNEKIFIAPAYIYEREDIFGVSNIYPNGTMNNNDQLVVLVTYQPWLNDNFSMVRTYSDKIQRNVEEQYITVLSNGIIRVGVLAMTMIGVGIICKTID